MRHRTVRAMPPTGPVVVRRRRKFRYLRPRPRWHNWLGVVLLGVAFGCFFHAVDASLVAELGDGPIPGRGELWWVLAGFVAGFGAMGFLGGDQ